MYAVIKTGGKQYKVQEGDTIRVEKLDGKEGDEIKLDSVLMLTDGEKVTVGTPMVKGASVSATVKAQGRGKKIKIIKFKMSNNRSTRGNNVARFNIFNSWSITMVSGFILME